MSATPKSARTGRRQPRSAHGGAGPAARAASAVFASRSQRSCWPVCTVAGRTVCGVSGQWASARRRASSFVLASTTPSPYQSAGRCVHVAIARYRRVMRLPRMPCARCTAPGIPVHVRAVPCGPARVRLRHRPSVARNWRMRPALPIDRSRASSSRSHASGSGTLPSGHCARRLLCVRKVLCATG
jgi:hypothetical protein